MLESDATLIQQPITYLSADLRKPLAIAASPTQGIASMDSPDSGLLTPTPSSIALSVNPVSGSTPLIPSGTPLLPQANEPIVEKARDSRSSSEEASPAVGADDSTRSTYSNMSRGGTDIGAVRDPVPPQSVGQDSLRTLENYRQLSIRLAEAMGQRIMGMLNRGEWQLALQLNPAHLGRVDVKLTLRPNRTIDAEFKASRVDTAGLLMNGEMQLKFALDQAGFSAGQISSRLDSNLDASTANPQSGGGSQRGSSHGPSSPINSTSARNNDAGQSSNIVSPERLDVFV